MPRADESRGREPAELDVGREPDPPVDAPLPHLLLLTPEGLRVDALEQLVEARVVVARVVGDAERAARRERVRRDEVLTTELHAVDPELRRRLVDQHLE